ncbi:MAG: hypothetical protein GY820_09265 [Gammaproteobacteria bacterium]|nr:hypothetical protein [Gammaproteobacteria bacterium]
MGSTTDRIDSPNFIPLSIKRCSARLKADKICEKNNQIRSEGTRADNIRERETAIPSIKEYLAAKVMESDAVEVVVMCP